MKNLARALCMAFFALTVTAGIAADFETKLVTLDAFMQGNVLGNINVPIIVPAQFEPAKLPKANFGYSYWMNPNDVAASNASGDLPGENGYMYGKISPNVGYDIKRNIFIGLEEPESIKKAKQQMADLVIERYKFGPHAIALLKFSIENKLVYSMYVSTNIATNVVYIALRPPKNSNEIGDQIWSKLKASLEKSKSGTE